MVDVNLLQYKNQLKLKEGFVWGVVRKKWYVIQPEELVRQLFLFFLNHHLNIPFGRISVERKIKVNELQQRYDILAFDAKGNPWLLVECKGHHVELNQDTLDQVSRYNQKLNVPYLAITNGRQYFFFKLCENTYQAVENLPSYTR